MSENHGVKDLGEINENDACRYGHKAVNLGLLMKAGFNVPNGIVFSHDFLSSIISNAHSRCRPDSVELTYGTIRGKFGESWPNKTLLVVRSSASVEDTEEASFAGIFKSVTRISNNSQLFRALMDCWDARNSENVKIYMHLVGMESTNLKLALIVQKMIVGEIGGVTFTRNPLSSSTNEILIESCYGSCDKIVEGTCNPDRYLVKRDLDSFRLFHNDRLIRSFDDRDDQDEDYGIKGPLNLCRITELVRSSRSIEKLFGGPQDIEWTFKGDELYILQSRPLRTRVED